MTMMLALLLLLPFDSPALAAFVAPAGLAQDKQDKVELKEFQASYQLTAPEGYHDRVSWPAILDLGGPKEPVREPGCFVISVGARQDAAFALACLVDVKTRYRVNPERVIVRGAGQALTLASLQPGLFGGCVVQGGRQLAPVKKAPPCVFFVSKTDPDRVRAVSVAMVLRKGGVDVEVREPVDRPGAILEAIGPRIRAQENLVKADEFHRQGRYLDATLVCAGLVDVPEVERLARTKLRSIEGAALMELAKVEVAMADKKYKDAILRCREAARQFAWVPSGERIRRRLAELELRPEVKRALETED